MVMLAHQPNNLRNKFVQEKERFSTSFQLVPLPPSPYIRFLTSLYISSLSHHFSNQSPTINLDVAFCRIPASPVHRLKSTHAQSMSPQCHLYYATAARSLSLPRS